MNIILIVPVIFPIVVGLIALIIPYKRVRNGLLFVGISLTTASALQILISEPLTFRIITITLSSFRVDLEFMSTHFSSFILLGCCFFGWLIILYSFKQVPEKVNRKTYYFYILLTIAFANGAVLANNFIILLVFWGLIPVMLYLLINMNDGDAKEVAVKSFIIVGGTDFIMLFGVCILWHLTGSFSMNDMTITINGFLPTFAFILLLIGALGKAGSMPFHTWIPDAAEVAPATVLALFPAALDKLLGIYLLVRMVTDFFIINMSMKVLMMGIGSVTIVAAVMMALIQKDLYKLLAFHSVSQVGYMILGIGTGTPVGIAGGLFHMLNNTIYKTCLFLCGGAVRYRTHTTRLDRLGGLAKTMPITFITCAISALAISGVPPFNGFTSKWMIYQGTITVGGSIWPLFLIAAMFGSALTLASFVKVIHSLFLGERSKRLREFNAVGIGMKIPMVILSLFCIFFGVFSQFPIKYLIGPVIGLDIGGVGNSIHLTGMWSPSTATLLLVLSLVCGAGIYRLGNTKALKEGDIFVGGEPIDQEEIRIPGTQFYGTIESMGLLKVLYEKGKERFFDLYEWVRRASFLLSESLRSIHTGILSHYMLWMIFGLVILLLTLMKI